VTADTYFRGIVNLLNANQASLNDLPLVEAAIAAWETVDQSNNTNVNAKTNLNNYIEAFNALAEPLGEPTIDYLI
jgi:hypothetical protein